MQVDWIIKNVNLATLCDDAAQSYGAIHNGVLAVTDGKISWLGEQKEAPPFPDTKVVNGEEKWLTPGLIDCHTHLVYGGNRATEFEQRLYGVSYETIAKAGGGIQSTVKATREASDEDLLNSALHRLKQLHQEGVTTIEIKSGYGLDMDTELRLLKTARELEKHIPVHVATTYLGAHALPPEYAGRADDYIDFICTKVLPKVAQQKLADAVDAFCETIGFTLEQCQRVYETAQRLGLPIKGHAGQLSDMGGASLVAKFNGLSADHLEYLNNDDIQQLKQSGSVAVLLPAAFYFLTERQLPATASLRKADIPIAIATDCNPGSAPIASLLTAMNMACVLFGLTPEETLRGVTCNAAKALGLHANKGQLAIGYDADLLLWDIDHPAELSYAINMHKPAQMWVKGRHV